MADTTENTNGDNDVDPGEYGSNAHLYDGLQDGNAVPVEDTPRKLYQNLPPAKPSRSVDEGNEQSRQSPDSSFGLRGVPIDQTNYFSNRATRPSRRSQLNAMGNTQSGGLRDGLPNY